MICIVRIVVKNDLTKVQSIQYIKIQQTASILNQVLNHDHMSHGANNNNAESDAELPWKRQTIIASSQMCVTLDIFKMKLVIVFVCANMNKFNVNWLTTSNDIIMVAWVWHTRMEMI